MNVARTPNYECLNNSPFFTNCVFALLEGMHFCNYPANTFVLGYGFIICRLVKNIL